MINVNDRGKLGLGKMNKCLCRQQYIYMEDSHMKASESSFMYVFFQQSMSTTVEWNLRQKIVYS